MPHSAHQPKRLFLSYPRRDGETLATTVRKRLEAAGLPIWQDRTHLEAGEDFGAAIEQAIREADYLILIVTPAALESEYVRKEWEIARKEGVRVVPIKGHPHLDMNRMPRWMRSLHFTSPDIPAEWDALLETLRGPYEKVRVPFMAEDLPPHFVPRHELMDRLRKMLLDPERGDPIALTAALKGAGGYGKTLLARALCHDPSIQDAFHDGILWVTLGETPDLIGKLNDLCRTLVGSLHSSFVSVEAARTRFVELLGERDILLVLDDVWSESDLNPFLQGGKRCTRLITTRRTKALPHDARSIPVDKMTHEEAVKLLSFGLGSGEATALRELAKTLGYWPLLIKLANSTLREHAAKTSLVEAVRYVNTALAVEGMIAFENEEDREERHLAVSATMNVSLKHLTPDERQRYFELAIFPEDVRIPLRVLSHLWGISPDQTQKVCDRFDSLSLLQQYDQEEQHIQLHDVVREYLLKPAKTDMPATHQRLLESFGVTRWALLPMGERYLWEHLGTHLIGANRPEDLVKAVEDLLYLVRKVQAVSCHSAEKDMTDALHHYKNDKTLVALLRMFASSAHLIGACKTENDIGGTLHSRLQHLTELKAMCRELAAELPRPFITARLPPPDLPRPALLRAMSKHTDMIHDCAVPRRPEAQADPAELRREDFVVSASADKTLIVWEPRRGIVRHHLDKHAGEVLCCAACLTVAGDQIVVSGSADRTLRVWDAHSGVNTLTIDGHRAAVRACAISGDGSLLVSGSEKTLRLWDARNGQILKTLSGHIGQIDACAISPDDKWIVSASEDGTLRVWDIESGATRHILVGHQGRVLCCAIGFGGKIIVSGGEDGTLRWWNAQTGESARAPSLHQAPVRGCAFSPDGQMLATGCDDQTVHLWDTRQGLLRAAHMGHSGPVTGCAFYGMGRMVVSASEDGTLRLWQAAQAGAGHGHSRREGQQLACALSRDGRHAVTALPDNTLRVYNTTAGQENLALSGHTKPVQACEFSHDGRYVASAGEDDTLRLWDAQSGTLLHTFTGHAGWVRACAFSPSGDLLVSVGDDHRLRVWDVAQRRLLHALEGHTGWVYDCDFHPDGVQVVTISKDKTARLWDVRAGKLVRIMEGRLPITCCAFTPDGEGIVTAGRGELHIFNTATGKLRGTPLRGHDRPVTDITVTPDGRYLISSSLDKSIRAWNLQTGQLAARLAVDSPLAGCAVQARPKVGYQIVAVGERGVFFLEMLV